MLLTRLFNLLRVHAKIVQELLGHSTNPGPTAMIRGVRLKPGVAYDPPPNAIFLPTMGLGKVTTTPPDLGERARYETIEVALEPEMVYAQYLAEWLSGPEGR